MAKTIRIASGQGFWGDWLEAPVRQVDGGPIDYLMMDYLAEVTMSILQKQKERDPKMGYARDVVPLLQRILPKIVERNIRVTTNAGGVNPDACAAAIAVAGRALGLGGKLKIGIVGGDDILGRLDDMIARGVSLADMETGRPLSDVRDKVLSANVYLGAWPVVDALKQGAHVVVTGRVTDTGLTLAPIIHEFGWKEDDWNLLAAGTIAGHINECGAQCSGGNYLAGWPDVKGLEDVGYPIIEAAADGTFSVTKHPNTGGTITTESVTEQLLYEMGDPRAYITPDCVADFTSIRLEAQGTDRVRVHGISGKPRTESLKVSIAYRFGFKAVGTLVYSWPDAYAKAREADRILRARLERLGLKYDEILTEYVGVNATHGPLAGEPAKDIAEVQLRVGVRSADKAAVERFTRELAPLILNGPPSVTGFAGGRPKVEEIVAYWPALVPRHEIRPEVRVVTA